MMTAREEYLRAVTALTPDEVKQYLASRGWQLREETRLGATIWTHGVGAQESEVLVPKDRELRDYLSRIRDVIGTLAAVEDRPEQDVLRDLSEPYVDTQYFRTQPGTRSGTTPILSGIAALEGVRDLMEAAAYAEVRRPAPLLPSRKPSETVAFVRGVRVGPTRPGSYVFAAQVPLTVPNVTLFEVEPPFERRVLLKLYQALRAAQSAASEALRSDDLDAFDEQVEHGVSANLCRALARLGGPDADRDQPRPFDVTFSWASGLPSRVRTVPVRFRPQLIRVLDSAADELGAIDATGAVVITGKIKKTARDDPLEPGQVQVRGTIETQSGPRDRAVWMRLDPDRFDRAVDAFRRDVRVRAAGDLNHTGKRMELDPLREFGILGDG